MVKNRETLQYIPLRIHHFTVQPHVLMSVSYIPLPQNTKPWKTYSTEYHIVAECHCNKLNQK